MIQVPEDRIERSDLESGLRDLQQQIVGQATQKQRPLALVIAGLAIVIVIFSYGLGRRSGKRRSGILEIRR